MPDSTRAGAPSSIAAVGFALAAYAVGAERRFITRTEATKRVHATLRFFWDSWGDIDDATYRREKTETEAMLAALPDEDKLVAFDRQRAAVLHLSAAMDALNDEERKRMIALFVEEVGSDGNV